MRFLFLCASLLAGCNRVDLGKYEILGELRVLSLQADKPEVNPGTAVAITPYVSDLRGAGRALTYSAEGCIDPGIDLGAEPTCAGRSDRTVLFDKVAVTGLAAPNYTGAVNAVNVNVPATALAGRSDRDKANGVAYLVFYALNDSTGVTLLTSLKKIIVSTKTTLNQNPVLASVQVDGAAPATLPTAVAKLSPVFTGDPKESFVFVDQNGTSTTYQEEIVTTWFLTDGEVEESRTGGTDAALWTPPAAAVAGRQVQVIAVSRDRRGGESVQQLAF